MAKLKRTYTFWSSLYFLEKDLHQNMLNLTLFLFLSTNEAQLLSHHSLETMTHLFLWLNREVISYSVNLAIYWEFFGNGFWTSSISWCVFYVLLFTLSGLFWFSRPVIVFLRFAVIASGCASCPRLMCHRDGCGAEFCYHCKQAWHPNQTCDSARQQRAQSLHTHSNHSPSYTQEQGPGECWQASSASPHGSCQI